MKVAIFDFDGTLYKNETFPVMMEHLKNHPKYSNRYRSFFLKVLPSYLGSKLRIYPRKKMQTKAMQYYINALARLSEEEVYQFFKEIAEKFSQDFNMKLVSRFHKHLQDGDYIMLVSGAYVPLLKQATRSFPFHKIIGTEVAFKKNEIDLNKPISHIQGPKKVERILQALQNKTIDWENSYAYADSYSDRPVFDLVGNPVVVDPDEKLIKHARTEGWTIL